MDSRPIGVFDSGVGGLSAVRVLRALLPGEDILYFGDTANVPYGGKSVEELRSLASASSRLLAGKGAKALLVACGTVSSTCLEVVGRVSGLPCCGVLRGAALRACNTTRNGRVGVLSTEATARSGAFEREIRALRPELAVFSFGTSRLVPLAEAGRTEYSDPLVREAVEDAAARFSGSGIDTLILGCTHFPLLAPALARAFEGVRLIDSGETGAGEFMALLRARGLLSAKKRGGRVTAFVSGGIESFEKSAGLFLPGGLDDIREVDA